MKQTIEINGTELELAFDEDGYDNAEDVISDFIHDQEMDDLISDEDTREWADCEYDEYVYVDTCGISININAFDLIEEENEWSAVKEANEDSIKDKISEYITEEVREHLDCTEPYTFTCYECFITVHPKEEDEGEEKTPIPTSFCIRFPLYEKVLAEKDIRITVTDDPSTTDTSALEKAYLMVGIQRVFDPYNGNVPSVARSSWERAYEYARNFVITMLPTTEHAIREHYAEVEREEMNTPWTKYIALTDCEQMTVSISPVTEDAQEDE